MATVLITGATGGIGYALAQRYAQRGDRLVLVGRRAPDTLADAFFAPDRYCHADLHRPDCADVVARWLAQQEIATIDILVHNAGIGYVGAIADQVPANINALIDVNLVAPLALTHRLLPLLQAAQGSLVFISSVAATLPTPDYAVYSATKAALDAFSRNLRQEFEAAGRPISIHVIHPGATRTEMHAKAGLPPAQRRSRLADPDDVAASIVQAVARGRRTHTVGAMNSLVFTGVRATGTTVDRMLRQSARRAPVSPQRTLPTTAGRPHALITGAADGIGRALALELATRGYAVTGVDVDAPRGAAVAAELRAQGCDARFITVDLARREASSAILEQLAGSVPLTLFVHNAGINAVGPFDGVAWSAQRAVLDVNLRAPLLLTRAVLAQDHLAYGGTVVWIASLSRYIGYPGAATYAATKDGLVAYARSLSVALAPANVNVLTVYPGPTRTAHARRYSPDNRREHRRMAPQELAQRIVGAVERRQRQLIPGVGNRAFAVAGRLAPWLVDRAMRRAIFAKIAAATASSSSEKPDVYRTESDADG